MQILVLLVRLMLLQSQPTESRWVVLLELHLSLLIVFVVSFLYFLKHIRMILTDSTYSDITLE